MTCDDVLFGRLKILQPQNGPRVNMDTILLSSWVRVRSGTHEVLEAGCASGAVSLILAMKYGSIHVTGIDIQEELVRLAELNATNNGLNDRAKFIAGDIRDKDILPREHFDVLVVNPPYSSLSSGRESPDISRTTARLEASCTPDDVAELAFRTLKCRGRLFAVFASGRLDVFMAAMMRHRITPKRLRFVYPNEGTNSGIFLSEFVKLGGEGLSILPPLYVGDKEGNYTPELLKAYEPDGNI
ncbi:MAG: methyltransferase domain-containing protein [Synergistaceae bacterium]|nr:methyltransferase domain-containing protein [Synergistaceae bacterium]